jgi:hypothetical protein
LIDKSQSEFPDVTAFCTTVASTRNAKTSVTPFFTGVVVIIVVATAH